MTMLCPRCGRENADDARFCSNCGNSLVTRVGVQERRVVTALFADLVRSTGMGEALDPELVRGIVGRFFELCSREVGARGGTIEKFSGDAVMAVFGIPSAHEDDPERAVRAALAIRDGLAEGVNCRIGIESGEVVVGDPFGGSTMATGDAMNVAARLEQSAEPGEVIIGPVVRDHVKDLVEAEDLGTSSLRGHEEPVHRWRVTSVSSEVGRPRGVPGLEAPLTGRDEELAMLMDAAERAQRERKAVLFTILGLPGLGKSRLIRETSARLADRGWSVVRGRCLPYGDGITYWPVAEMVRALAGIGPDMATDVALDRLRRTADDADVAGWLALAVGLQIDESGAQVSDRDIAYAFRRFVEHVGATAPLLLIFEDIHWAELPMLDLIEYLATWTRDTPLLIACPSRPELLDRRASWGSGRMEASRISLEPLTEVESRALLGALLAVEDLPAALRQRVLDRAEGNPLFVEEVVRMLIEEGVVEQRDGHWFANAAAANVRVPDSVEALIRARLDTLPAPERVVLQAASVVGRVFQQSAVAAVAPAETGRPSLEEHLEDAMLRDLITEERAPDEPTFRFRHILIRDVAYATLPKARRADLHSGVAAWLRSWAGTRLDEFVEIEAYHLEQTVKLRREVGGEVAPADVAAAATALLASATKAYGRSDSRAQRSFAERGLALDPSGDVRLDLRVLETEALVRLGEYVRAGTLAADLERDSASAGRRDLEGRAMYLRALSGWINPENADAKAALAGIRRARVVLEESQDWIYVTNALEALGYEGWWYGDMGKAADVWTEMADVAREHGLVDREALAVLLVSGAAGLRGNHRERRRLLSVALEKAQQSGNRLIQAKVNRQLGSFLCVHESPDEGRRLLVESAQVLDEFGDAEELSLALQAQADADFREGKLESALELYRRGASYVLEHVGYRPEVERRIATALLAKGDLAAAEEMAVAAVKDTAHDDRATVASTRAVLGEVRAAQGRLAEAEELLRSAAALLDGTDFPKDEEAAALAAFLYRVGKHDDAEAWLAKFNESVAGFAPEAPMRRFLTDKVKSAMESG